MNKNTVVLTVGSLVVASLGFLAGGCGGGHIGQLKEVASADLNCPKNRVHVLTKSGKTRDVEACQQNATYRWEGDDWRMVARSTPAAPGAAGAPVMKSNGGPPGVAPAQPAPVMTPTSTPTGTPSQPPPSSPPPAGGKQI